MRNPDWLDGRRMNDPDETAGRALYRALAEREARVSIGLTRKVSLMSSDAMEAGRG